MILIMIIIIFSLIPTDAEVPPQKSDAIGKTSGENHGHTEHTMTSSKGNSKFFLNKSFQYWHRQIRIEFYLMMIHRMRIMLMIWKIFHISMTKMKNPISIGFCQVLACQITNLLMHRATIIYYHTIWHMERSNLWNCTIQKSLAVRHYLLSGCLVIIICCFCCMKWSLN